MFLFFFLSLTGSIASNCPNGTYPSLSNPNQCFYFGAQMEAYMNAEKQCLNFGGHLTTIHSVEEDFDLGQTANSMFNNKTINNLWIGANAMNGKWEWFDGSAFDFTYWDISEPSTLTDNICGAISLSNGKWSAQNCFNAKPYICEFFVKDATTTTTTTTTTLSTVQPTTTTTSTRKPSKRCSTANEFSCGDVLIARIKRICGGGRIFKANKPPPNCPFETLEKMCCDEQCSDCDIKNCSCPHATNNN